MDSNQIVEANANPIWQLDLHEIGHVKKYKIITTESIRNPCLLGVGAEVLRKPDRPPPCSKTAGKPRDSTTSVLRGPALDNRFVERPERRGSRSPWFDGILSFRLVWLAGGRSLRLIATCNNPIGVRITPLHSLIT